MALILMFILGGGTMIINKILADGKAKSIFKADIKERCKPVYSTLKHSYVTTIYTCPDDMQYEFTESVR